MKNFKIPSAVLFSLIVLSLAGCLPKKAGTTGSVGTSTSSSPVSGNSGGLGSNWTPTPTPFATITSSSNPTIKVQNIIKRQPDKSTPTQANSIWLSTSEPSIGTNGAAFVTDKVFKYRIKVNAQPHWSYCGPWPAMSHTGFSYQKLQMKVTVKNDTSGYVCNSDVIGPINVGSSSPVMEVSSSCLNQAVRPIVQIDSVTSDTQCQWCRSSYWNQPESYCNPWGCNPLLPDPTQCWSIDLEVATSNTQGL